MKKILTLSVALTLVVFGFQGSASAQESPDDLVDNLCQELKDLRLTDDNEIAEMVRSYIAELDQPTMDQIIALSQVAVKVETGKSINSICR
ncbi:MAG: hypothetical protein AAF378_22675 [Cyanobacteria bacterium P01_A01_bin.84]